MTKNDFSFKLQNTVRSALQQVRAPATNRALSLRRAANLYRSLSDGEAARLLGPLCLGSHAVRAMVPGDDAGLLALALAEKLDTLNRVAAVAAHLGRRCTAPALMGFGHVYAGLLAGRSDAGAFAVASASEAASLVRKLDRLAAATAALYAELEALTELKQSARKPPTDEACRALDLLCSCSRGPSAPSTNASALCSETQCWGSACWPQPGSQGNVTKAGSFLVQFRLCPEQSQR